jgi:hypothetical protein
MYTKEKHKLILELFNCVNQAELTNVGRILSNCLIRREEEGEEDR